MRKDDDMQKLLGIAGIAIILIMSGIAVFIEIAKHFAK